MKKLTSLQIHEIIGGEIINPSADVIITEVASLAEAAAHSLSFLGNKKYEPLVESSSAGIIIVPESYQICDDKCYIVSENPSASFSVVIDLFAPAAIEYPAGIHDSAVVSESAELGDGVHVGANAVIMSGVRIGANSKILPGTFIGQDSIIGDDCVLYANVSIRERVTIKNRVIIHCGSSIGSDGFGFIPGASGHTKIPQVGTVCIEDDVEIGSSVVIDRARFGSTRIGEGTKIDNLVQIAHNVQLGKHCFLVAQSGIAGSAELGHFVTIAGQSGVAGHITIGDGAIVLAKSAAISDVAAGEKVIGFPAVSRREYAKNMLAFKKIDKLEKQLRELKASLNS